MARPDSENGWRPPRVGADACQWVKIPGTNVTLQILKGWPLATLRAFAADFHAYVEPLRDADSACYTPTNSVATSNHLNGTAMDLNWNSHPFHAKGTFTAAQMVTIRELLAFYEGTMFWAGDWDSPIDEMHWQMGYGSWDNPKTGDFIARKIRADGFSTFRRGGTPSTPVQPGVNAAFVLARATGLSEARAAEILPTMVDGLKQADCTNPNRIAMFIAQTGHESADFQRTEEYASGAAYEGRTNLGNTQPGDGVRFKGRSWIQITGRHNYGEFSEWAFGKGLVPTPTYFVDHPVELQDLKWAGIGAAWYWTVARSDINALSDRRDLDTVTRRINGGTTGIADRRNRYNRALAVGDQLLTLLTGEDELSAEAERKIAELHAAFLGERNSKSIYATPGGRKWRIHELVENDDAFLHEDRTESQALAGSLDDIARVALVAAGQGVVREAWAVARAQRVLNQIEADNPAALQQFLNS